MLSEEEKKAIELLECIKNNSWTTKYIMSSDSKNADILLHLITKLQKENEKYKYLYQKALDNTVSSDRENIQLKEQIDLMARAIDNYDSQLEINTFRDKEHVKQYFKEIAERKSEE